MYRTRTPLFDSSTRTVAKLTTTFFSQRLTERAMVTSNTTPQDTIPPILFRTMAKSKPRHRAKNRANPAAKPISDPKLAAIRDQRILPVLKDLQSPDLKTRSSAARAVTNLIEDQTTRKLLLREQIVRVLLEQTLSDSNWETSTDGWGIMRNLSLEEEPDFCIHLYRQDILTAIEGAILKVGSMGNFSVLLMLTDIQIVEACRDSSQTKTNYDPLLKLPAAHQELLWNQISSIISLVTSLSESQDEIAEAITSRPTIVDFLFSLLDFDSTPTKIQSEVLSCLTSLTEDNKLLAERIVESQGWLKGLLHLAEAGCITSIGACAVLHNIFLAMQWFDHCTPIKNASDASLIPVLSEYMKHILDGGSGQPLDCTETSRPDPVLQLAIEIIANITSSLQETVEPESRNEKSFEGSDVSVNGDMEDMNLDGDDAIAAADDVEKESSDDEMTHEEIEAEMEMVLGDGSDDDDSNRDEDEAGTLACLVRLAAPQLSRLARPIQGSVGPVQEHALSALSNIAWAISSVDFSARDTCSLRRRWIKLAPTIWADVVSPVLASNTADIELASSITSLAWALARSSKGAFPTKQHEEQRKFMALYHASKNLAGSESGKSKAEGEADAFQSLGVKCIGVLGSLAIDPATVELNREIGIFLLKVLSDLPDIPAADAVEAMNQIMDIYSDKSYSYDEPVYWGDNLTKHLEDILPKAKTLAKTIDKRKFNELRSRADEAIFNLGRFLMYKRKERKSKDVA